MAKSLWTAFTEFRLGPETYCAMAYLFQFLNKRLDYKLLSLTYEVLTTSQPDYLHNLISVQSAGRTRSSSLVTLAKPSESSSITNHQPLFHICITLPVPESAPFFIPSTSLCSLSSWLTSSCTYQISPHHSHHLYAVIIYHCLAASHSRLKNQGRIQDLKLGGVKCGLGGRMEAPTGVRSGEGVSPPQWGWGYPHCPLPIKISAYSPSKWCILMHSGARLGQL